MYSMSWLSDGKTRQPNSTRCTTLDIPVHTCTAVQHDVVSRQRTKFSVSPTPTHSNTQHTKSTMPASTSTAGTAQDEEDACPICLFSSSEPEEAKDALVFCRAACSHSLCQTCVERILLGKRQQSPSRGGMSAATDQEEEDARLNSSTLGRCPICRQAMSLFDLILSSSTCGEKLYEKNHNATSWLIHGSNYRHDTSARMSSGMSFSFEDNCSILLFDPPRLLENGSSIESLVFEKDSHFHEKSCTFHGSVRFPSPTAREKYIAMDCLLQFSRDLRYICDGYLQWHFAKLDPNTNAFPLDGTWRVQWEHNSDTATITLRGHQWSLFQFDYQMEIVDNLPRFTWPMRASMDATGSGIPTVQTAITPIPIQTDTTTTTTTTGGPAIGERMEWTTTHPHNPKIIWTRLLAAKHSMVFLSPSRGLPVYKRHVAATDESHPKPRPTYHAATLWGNTFCQGFRVGLASYHFVGPPSSSSYISYENPLTSQWPPLDDGSPIPSRVSFRAIEWDKTDRIFRGDICWQEDYGTTWQGCRKWMYEMKFDSTYSFIVSGSVRTIMEFSSVPQEMSNFADDLVYINAAIADCLRINLRLPEPDNENGNNDGEVVSGSPQSLSERYVSVSQELRAQWLSENASVRTMAMLHTVLSKIWAGHESPIDMNLF
jgi:hypothetical protein